MPRTMALVVSGVVTAFILVVVVGLVAGANWVNQNVEAAPVAAPVQATGQAVQTTATSSQDAAQIADLQAQVAAYRSQLQQAVDALQAAYDQIAVMQQQQALPGSGSTLNGGRRGGRTFNGSFNDD